MDGRWKRLLASSALIGLVGCSSMGDKKPAPPVSTSEPPLSSASAKPSKNNPPPKIETLLAFANVQLEAARLPDRTDKDRATNLALARDKYQEVLKRDPKNLDAMLGMARASKLTQDTAGCLDWYQRATKANPNNAPLWGEMGQSLDGLKDRDTAISCYHKAATIDPSNSAYRKALGLALARAGRYAESYAWLSQCMPVAEAHVCVARMMDHNGQHEQAYQHFAAALKADPNNETARLAMSNAPNDGIPVANPIQTASYQQYIPAQAEPYRQPAAPNGNQPPR